MDELEDARRVLASIALTEANGNSEPDVMADALDTVCAHAQAYFKRHHLRVQDYVSPPSVADAVRQLHPHQQRG